MLSFIIFLVIIAVIAFWIMGIYNGLVSSRNRFKNAFSQIDIQLKRRYDLIPNLVEVAKNYMKHERETLEAVIAARTQAVSANSRASADPADAAAVQQLAQAEGSLSASLGRLLAVSESYPELKANENMMQLSEELSSTENKIAFARQAYNDSVMQYNIAVEQFPANLIAGMFGFRTGELLQATESAEERKAVKVSFN